MVKLCNLRDCFGKKKTQVQQASSETCGAGKEAKKGPQGSALCESSSVFFWIIVCVMFEGW